MSAFLLVSAANKANIKPIVGIELNVCDDMYDRSHKDDGHSLVFLAKNKKNERTNFRLNIDLNWNASLASSHFLTPHFLARQSRHLES